MQKYTIVQKEKKPKTLIHKKSPSKQSFLLKAKAEANKSKENQTNKIILKEVQKNKQ